MIFSQRLDILCFALEYAEKLITRTTVTLAKGGRAPIKAISYICVQIRGWGTMSTNQQHSHAGPLSAINSEYIGRYLGNCVLYMSVAVCNILGLFRIAHVCIRVLTFSRGVCKKQHQYRWLVDNLVVQCLMRRSPTTARVAQMVDVPEATCVLYRLRNLLRVDSSMVQIGFEVGVLESGEAKGACSEGLSLVIPGNSPLRADQDCSIYSLLRLF